MQARTNLDLDERGRELFALGIYTVHSSVVRGRDDVMQVLRLFTLSSAAPRGQSDHLSATDIRGC